MALATAFESPALKHSSPAQIWGLPPATCGAGVIFTRRLTADQRRLLLALALHEKIADDREAQRKRHPQYIFHQRRALLDAFVEDVCFCLLLRDHRADILQKIDAAFFAFAAGALLVVARGALVAHRVVATLAEARHIAHVGAALRALHCLLGRGRGWRT